MGGSPGIVGEVPVSLILQPFRRFTYVTANFPTIPSLQLRHSEFHNPSFASLHHRHFIYITWRAMILGSRNKNIVRSADLTIKKTLRLILYKAEWIPEPPSSSCVLPKVRSFNANLSNKAAVYPNTGIPLQTNELEF